MATEQIHEIAVLRQNDGTGISSTEEDLRIGRVNQIQISERGCFDTKPIG
jgi:hypothetical protein